MIGDVKNFKNSIKRVQIKGDHNSFVVKCHRHGEEIFALILSNQNVSLFSI